MPSSSTLNEAFLAYGRRFFETYPEIPHSWHTDESPRCCTLSVPAADQDGFDITLEVSPEEIIVYCSGFHDHLHLKDSPDDLANSTFGLLYDLLSPQMRLREFIAGKSAYKWTLEIIEDGECKEGSTSGLLVYNYLGKRSEKIYQNRVLPSREQPLRGSEH